MKRKLMIAGGGTGGHVLAGVAIAQAWNKRFGLDGTIVYVGARGRIEERIVPQHQIKLYLLSLGSLNRVSFLRKILTVLQLPWALIKSLFLIVKEKPDAVIGVGGYASGPVLLMASFLSKFFSIQTAVLEQNSVPGLTNRILGRFVEKIFCAFTDHQRLLPAKKIEVTGNPIRMELTSLGPAPIDPFQLFIFGGSQGARGLNTLVIETMPLVQKKFPNVKIIHQTGVLDYLRVKRAYEDTNVKAKVVEFIDNMKEVYQDSTLLICRAGSSTLAEIAAIQRAAILVPLPTASDGHQLKNAEALVSQGAAVLAEQTKTSPEQLAKKIFDLIEHPQKLHEIEKKAHTLHRPHAASDIVKQFEF